MSDDEASLRRRVNSPANRRRTLSAISLSVCLYVDNRIGGKKRGVRES